MTPARRIGWYSDDLTGGTDTLSVLAQRGMRAILHVDVPDEKAAGTSDEYDAVGIAGATRAMTREEIAAALADVGPFFARAGVTALHYKCCSTFDSSPDIGNLHEAARALMPHFANPLLAIVGGQPNLGRYCVFGHLFARAGRYGETYRIDRHPTMRAHPVTPMTESDLRVHLAAQGFGAIGLLPYPVIGEGGDAAARHLAAECAVNPEAVLMDVSRPADLDVLGRLLWDAVERDGPLLAIGASSVMQALTADAPPRPVAEPARPPQAMPALALIGSLSPVTREQLALASDRYETSTADASRLVADSGYRAALAERVVHSLSSGNAAAVATDPARSAIPPAEVAAALGLLAAEIVAATKVHRLAVIGGDTSSGIARAVGVRSMTYLGIMGDGVVRCRVSADTANLDGADVVFKGGQMGAPDFLQAFAAT